MQWWEKAPAADLDWSWNWADWLGQAETIASQTVTAAPTGLTVHDITAANGIVTAWLSGGTEGERYTVTCEVTTSADRTDERSITVLVTQR